jgi:undecaprenyl-diphosphatase
MVDFLIQIDTFLFVLFNVKLANPLFDIIMPFITAQQSWYAVWLFLLIYLPWKGGKKGRWAILLILLSFAAADASAYRIFKPWIQRIRPCNVIENVHLLVGNKTSWSMPSNHAANFFAVATVLSWFYRKYRGYFYFLAALVAYSRVAVGVHYPFDVMAGALLGYTVAKIWLCLFTIADKKYQLLFGDKGP